MILLLILATRRKTTIMIRITSKSRTAQKPSFRSVGDTTLDLKYCLQSLRRPNILAHVRPQPMKRSLVYSVTVMLAAGLISSCTTKTESTSTTTTPEKAPAKKESTTTKKSSTKKESSTDATKKESTTTKKESTKKSDSSASPSPSPSATP